MADSHDLTLLTAAEETRLALTIEAGVLAGDALRRGLHPCDATTSELLRLEFQGREAWQRFLLANLRLVWMVARREARRTRLPAEDLFQEGFVALADSLQRYDCRRARFSTYALPRIRQHVAEVAAGRLGEVPLPRKRALMMRRALGLGAALSQDHGRTVGVHEIAAALGRSEAWTAELLSYDCPPARLDDADASVLAASLVFPSSSDDADACESVRTEVLRLPVDQREVIMLRFGFRTGQPQACAEVADRLRMSQSTVRRLERRALARLRGSALAS